MQADTSIGSRLVELRGQSTQADFAASIGINVNTLRAYEKGRAQPNADTLAGVCAKFSVSPSWLLLGEGPMVAGASVQRAQPEPGCDVEMIYVPLVEARLSAGTGSFETGENADEAHLRRYGFRSDFLSRKGSIPHMVLMRVDGDSMEPRIFDNDVVLIDQSKTTPRAGGLYAVGVEDVVYIKMVDTLPGKIILKSFNPAYVPLEIDARGDLADGIRIIGKAIWLGRELR